MVPKTLTRYFLLLLTFGASGISCSLKYEKLLHKDLLNDYNPDIRPEPGHNQPVEVHLDVRVKKLIKLDVREQVLKINAFTMLRWTDPQLAWNTSKYDGVRYITMSSDLLWTPDVVLYNSANEESKSHADYYKTKVSIYRDGDVVWVAPVTWSVSCSFDVTWFPIDKQICNLTFGSWTYPHTELRVAAWTVHNEDMTPGHFTVKNGEWKILERKIHYQNISFSCCPESYSAMIYEFKLTRLSLYYFMYILLPLISLAFLSLAVFFIPYNTGERMGFGVTILLSITVYLLVISEQLPEKSDDKSMLGICFIIEFYLLCLALVLSLVTANLSSRKKKPPEYLVKFYNFVHRKRKSEKETGIEMEVLQANTNESEHKRGNRNIQWCKIAMLLDRIFFASFTFLMCFVPIIVTASLDATALGSIH